MNIRNACSNYNSIPAGDVGKIYEFGARVLLRLGFRVESFHSQKDGDGIGTHIYLDNGMHLFLGLNPQLGTITPGNVSAVNPAQFQGNFIDYAFGFAIEDCDFSNDFPDCIYVEDIIDSNNNKQKWSFFKLPSVTPDSDISLLDMETLAAECVSMLGKYTG